MKQMPSQVLTMKTKNDFAVAMSYFSKFHERACEDALTSGDFEKVMALDFFKGLSKEKIKKYGSKILNSEMEVARISALLCYEDLTNDEMMERALSGGTVSNGNEGDMIEIGDSNPILNGVVDFLSKNVSSLLNTSADDLIFKINHIVEDPVYQKYLSSFNFAVNGGHSNGALSSEDTRTYAEVNEKANLNGSIARGLVPIVNAIKFYAKQFKESGAKIENMLIRSFVSPIIQRTCFSCNRTYFLYLGFKDWSIQEFSNKVIYRAVGCSMVKEKTPFEFGSTIVSTSGKLVLSNNILDLLKMEDVQERFEELKSECSLSPSLGVMHTLGARITTQVFADLKNVGAIPVQYDDVVFGFEKSETDMTITAKNPDTDEFDMSLDSGFLFVTDMEVLKNLAGEGFNKILETSLVVDAPVGTYHIATKDIFNKDGDFIKIKKISDDTTIVAKSNREIMSALGIVDKGYDKVFEVRIGNRGARI